MYAVNVRFNASSDEPFIQEKYFDILKRFAKGRGVSHTDGTSTIYSRK